MGPKAERQEKVKTKVVKIKPDQMDIADIREAAELIRTGGLVAFPTETVYGLGADALCPKAAKKIYAAKGRPSDNPLIVHIAEYSQLSAVAREVPEEADLLARAFWPGPLTMIVRKNQSVPSETTGGMDTVAVRMPSHPAALGLIRESGCLIAAPSANVSGRPSPTEAAHVAADMDGRIPMILDGGPVGIGIESTIVDLTEEVPMILRPGFVTAEMIGAVLGREIRLDPGITASDSVIRPKAPGMKYRHYAPKAELILAEGETERVIAEINRLTEEKRQKGLRVGVMAANETAGRYKADCVLCLGPQGDGEAAARQLYGTLREFDRQKADIIYAESLTEKGVGAAVMNRLCKAAGHQVLYV